MAPTGLQWFPRQRHLRLYFQCFYEGQCTDSFFMNFVSQIPGPPRSQAPAKRRPFSTVCPARQGQHTHGDPRSAHQQQHDRTAAGTSASHRARHDEREAELRFGCLNASKNSFLPLAFFWPFKPISWPCKAGGVPSANLEKDTRQTAQNTWLTEMEVRTRLAALEISRSVEIKK